MRKAVQITGAALCAAVLMTGCSSSSGGGKKDDKPVGGATPTSQAPAEQPSSPAADTGGQRASAATLAGGWSNNGKLTDQSLLILVFTQDKVTLSGKTACSGTLVTTSQPATITIKHCQDNSTDYATGTIKDFDGKSFTVAWASGKQDKMSKTVGSDGKPTGVPGGIAGGLPTKPKS
ncbi:hypothetical protein Q3V23_16360 [Streptomyces sp. VNUA116]|uniref:hypothetical protein n=1 Tax=Streptomyces sp. VNUA116 TaxID=3062449 RepID=UPI002676BC13|nr:hypothetical protein [Streptomyces sp. VNUA116]WKU45514.1 hypothetical protein Q3V23_16360 [Streptomyces sp. VNUA116]